MTQNTALVMKAVAGGYRYGFDVMEACGLPSGTVYPALRRLEKSGFLKSRWEGQEHARANGRPRRRTYELTTEGWRILPEAEEKLREVRRLLGDFPPSHLEKT